MGTSTPEFAVSLAAIRQGSVGVSVGNVVGSDIFNVLGGARRVIRLLTVSATAVESTAWLTVVVVVAAMWSGRRVSRLEGVLLALSEVVRGLSLFDVFG